MSSFFGKWEGVTSIEFQAFSSCTSLEYIIIKDEEKAAKSLAKREEVGRKQLAKEALARNYEVFLQTQADLKKERDRLKSEKIYYDLLGETDNYISKLKELNARII